MSLHHMWFGYVYTDSVHTIDIHIYILHITVLKYCYQFLKRRCWQLAVRTLNREAEFEEVQQTLRANWFFCCDQCWS